MTFSIYGLASYLYPEDGGSMFLSHFGDWNVIVFSCHSNLLTWNSIVTTLCPVFFTSTIYRGKAGYFFIVPGKTE